MKSTKWKLTRAQVMTQILTLFLTLFLTLILTLTMWTAASAASAEAIPGGWMITTDAQVTEEARQALDQALEGFVGSKIEPVALLGTQVVAGMNYCLLCRITPDAPNAAPDYDLVYVYQALDGTAELLGFGGLDVSMGPDFDWTSDD